MTPEETYALKIVVDYAESGVEDDIDEDGELASEAAHDEAMEIAFTVINWMRAHPERLLGLARASASAPAPSAI